MEIIVVQNADNSDNPVEKIAAQMGYDVFLCQNSEKALDLIRARSIRFVVINWQTPDKQSYRLCRTIRDTIADKYVYIFVWSLSDTMMPILHAFQAGADDCWIPSMGIDILKVRLLAGLRIVCAEVPDRSQGDIGHDVAEQLQKMRNIMLQSEKMASIGQLTAGVAHEINTPTGYVANNLKTLEKYQIEFNRLIKTYRDLLSALKLTENKSGLSQDCQSKIEEIETLHKDMEIDFLLEDVLDLIGDCRQGAERIKTIVTDLKAFAHPGDEAMKFTDINQGLATTLNVVYNELKYKAELQTEFGPTSNVMAVSQQLNQVFMNLLINAAQSIEKNGQIFVKTRENNGFVEIVISDTGCGIPEKDLNRIFDPFYTTKPIGKGTGLGMHIARDIIQKHRGDILVQSQVGKGTTFTVRLPVAA